MAEVKVAFISKELPRRLEGKEEYDGEGLTARGRHQKRNNKNSRGNP